MIPCPPGADARGTRPTGAASRPRGRLGPDGHDPPAGPGPSRTRVGRPSPRPAARGADRRSLGCGSVERHRGRAGRGPDAGRHRRPRWRRVRRPKRRRAHGRSLSAPGEAHRSRRVALRAGAPGRRDRGSARGAGGDRQGGGMVRPRREPGHRGSRRGPSRRPRVRRAGGDRRRVRDAASSAGATPPPGR